MKKIVLSVAFVLLISLIFYSYFRFFGVKISTTKDAFALPAGIEVNVQSTHEFLVDVTPAPWPAEAGNIYQLVSWGIPVHVSLMQANEVQSFTIQRLNAQNHMVIEVHDAAQMKKLQEAFK